MLGMCISFLWPNTLYDITLMNYEGSYLRVKFMTSNLMFTWSTYCILYTVSYNLIFNFQTHFVLGFNNAFKIQTVKSIIKPSYWYVNCLLDFVLYSFSRDRCKKKYCSPPGCLPSIKNVYHRNIIPISYSGQSPFVPEQVRVLTVQR